MLSPASLPGGLRPKPQAGLWGPRIPKMGSRLIALVPYFLETMLKSTAHPTQDSDVTTSEGRCSGPLGRRPGSASRGLGYGDWKSGPREETSNSNMYWLAYLLAKAVLLPEEMNCSWVSCRLSRAIFVSNECRVVLQGPPLFSAWLLCMTRLGRQVLSSIWWKDAEAAISLQNHRQRRGGKMHVGHLKEISRH